MIQPTSPTVCTATQKDSIEHALIRTVGSNKEKTLSAAGEGLATFDVAVPSVMQRSRCCSAPVDHSLPRFSLSKLVHDAAAGGGGNLDVPSSDSDANVDCTPPSACDGFGGLGGALCGAVQSGLTVSASRLHSSLVLLESLPGGLRAADLALLALEALCEPWTLCLLLIAAVAAVALEFCLRRAGADDSEWGAQMRGGNRYFPGVSSSADNLDGALVAPDELLMDAQSPSSTSDDVELSPENENVSIMAASIGPRALSNQQSRSGSGSSARQPPDLDEVNDGVVSAPRSPSRSVASSSAGAASPCPEVGATTVKSPGGSGSWEML